ncbi:MAG: ABC transporter substrate-binding protein [Anaerolineae bacterium]
MGRLTAAATLLMFVFAACSSRADPTWERLLRMGTLRVGMDASFPPFESIGADGTPEGLDVDLAREIADRLDLRPQFVANLPYDGLYDALAAERVDVVVSALVVDPSRMEDYAYSISYFDAGPVLVSADEPRAVESIRDLAGHNLAVALGTEGDRQGREWARRLSGLVVVQYGTPTEALDALQSGETDIALVDHVSALQAMDGASDLVIIGEPVIDVPYACAVRRDSVRLLQAINEALRAMEEDGTIEGLMSRWLR